MKNLLRKRPRRRNFGCPLSLLFFFALLTFFLSAPSLFAQGVDETGGPLVTIDLEPICDDGTTTAWAIVQRVVGSANTTILGYSDAAGNDYTLTGTPTVGTCDGGGGANGPDYTVSVLTLCDSGTPFYRVAVFTNNTSTPTATSDFALDLSTAYTVSGTVYAGPCATEVTASITRELSTTTGNFAAGAFSYEICNQGTADGTVTIGGGSAATLIPGSCTSFRSTYDPASRQYRKAPAVSFVATGTSFLVIREN